MTTKEQFDLISDRVRYAEKIYSNGLACEMNHTLRVIYIRSDNFLSGVLVKDIAALCTVYGWSFGIFSDSAPYILINATV